MNWKHVVLLLLPISYLVFSICVDFYFSSRTAAYTDANQEIENQQKFDTFVNKVRSGEWQLTEEKMIEGMRLSRNTALSDRRILRSQGELMHSHAWGLVWMSLVQLISVFVVKYSITRSTHRSTSVASTQQPM